MPDDDCMLLLLVDDEPPAGAWLPDDDSVPLLPQAEAAIATAHNAASAPRVRFFIGVLRRSRVNVRCGFRPVQQRRGV
jgi:hypothetical protein